MEESLSKAKEIAEDWFLQLRGKLRAGEIKTEKPSAKLQGNSCGNMTSSRRPAQQRLCARVFDDLLRC